MVRIALWFLVTVTAVSLISATPVPPQGESINNAGSTGDEHDAPQQENVPALPKEILEDYIIWNLPLSDMPQLKLASRQFYQHVQSVMSRKLDQLRTGLGLPKVDGDYALFGLQLLLDGAELELRAMTTHFFDFFRSRSESNQVSRADPVRDYPYLFPDHVLEKLIAPPFVEQWLQADIQSHNVLSRKVKDGLINLGLVSNIDNVLVVVEALFDILTSRNLLTNFKTILARVVSELIDKDDASSNNQESEAAGLSQAQVFHTFVYSFWLEVIGGNNNDQLRYYLRHMLAFQIIPGMIGQLLETGWDDDAFELAERVTNVRGLQWVDKAFPEIAPNYFEFIVMYAVLRRPEGFEHLIDRAYNNKNDKTRFNIGDMYRCNRWNSHFCPWAILKDMADHETMDDSEPRFADGASCKAHYSQYTRGFDISNGFYVKVTTITGEDTSDLLFPEVVQYQAEE